MLKLRFHLGALQQSLQRTHFSNHITCRGGGIKWFKPGFHVLGKSQMIGTLFFPDFCHLQKHNRDDMKHFLFCWFIIGGWGYCHCHGFLNSDNLGWSQNKEIPDHLWFSRHMKSRLKNSIEQVWFVFPNFDSPIQSLVVISGCTSHWLRKWTSYRFLLLAQRCMA